MQIIAHRRNTIAELEATPTRYGVEIDLRSRGDRLVLHHDPFVDGCDFDEWLERYRHKTLILNVKEEGIEERVKERMAAHHVEDFFFLDLSFPSLVRQVTHGETRVAVRYSEFESIETVLTLAGKAAWVWVDCFTRLPVDGEAARRLEAAGFKLCIVSPELQGRDAAEIEPYRSRLDAERVRYDAVCTKRPELWGPS